MNTRRIFQHTRLGLILFGGLVLRLAMPTPSAAEETFPVLQVGTQTYTNVTVTTKAKKYIFIMHSAGMANIKLEDLSPEVQEQLGYISGGAKPKNQAGAVAAWAKEKMAAVHVSDVRAAELQKNWREQAANALPKLRSADPKLIYGVLGALVLLYLFFCYCSKLICDKTGHPPGILIWVPGFQMFPLLRAAGMSPLWFLAYLLPVLNLIAQIVWSVKIAKARGKSAWVGIFLLLPVTSLFAFLYLAFSDAVPPKEDRAVEVMCLETA